MAKSNGLAPLLTRNPQASVTSTDAGNIRVGDLELRPATFEATLAGEPLPLTPQEFGLLSLLARNTGRIVLSTEIARALWPEPGAQQVRQLGVVMSRLRKKLAPCRHYEIETVRKRGYRLHITRPHATPPQSPVEPQARQTVLPLSPQAAL